MQNMVRIVTDVTKCEILHRASLPSYLLILKGVPFTNGSNYRLKGGGVSFICNN